MITKMIVTLKITSDNDYTAISTITITTTTTSCHLWTTMVS